MLKDGRLVIARVTHISFKSGKATLTVQIIEDLACAIW